MTRETMRIATVILFSIICVGVAKSLPALTDNPKNEGKTASSTKTAMIAISGILLGKAKSRPIVGCTVYLVEVGPKGEVNAEFDKCPRGKTDKKGAFALAVDRSALKSMNSFVLVVTNCKGESAGLGIVMSKAIHLDSVPTDAKNISIGKQMIEGEM